MSADHTNNKKPLGKSNRINRDSSKTRIAKPGWNSVDNDPSSGQRHHDEGKIDRIDYSQQIGEFSNWSRRS
jgi:hypothetical protein